MVAPQSPIGARRRLGAELRRLRGKTGLTLDEVAEMMTCSTSKISRLETGKGVPKIPDVRELIRIYGVASDTERDMLLRLVKDGREHGWWEPLTDGMAPERFMMDAPGRYTALESDATAVYSFDITLVHGLLQTEDYIRAVISPLIPNRSASEIDRLVELRLMRQQALRRVDPLVMAAVVDEAVLLRPVGSAAVMAAQLRQIDELVDLPNVTFRVVPFDAGLLRAHVGHFVLLEIPAASGSDVAYVEGHAGEAFLDSPSDVDLYKDVFSDALEHALPPADSRLLVRRYLADHTHDRKAAQR